MLTGCVGSATENYYYAHCQPENYCNAYNRTLGYNINNINKTVLNFFMRIVSLKIPRLKRQPAIIVRRRERHELTATLAFSLRFAYRSLRAWANACFRAFLLPKISL